MNPGYSLTGIVTDQALMFERHEDEIDVFVAEKEKYNTRHDHQWPGLRIKHAVPRGDLTDYQSIKDVSEDSTELTARVCQFLHDEIAPNYDVILTHDWLLTGWNLPYARAFTVPKVQEALKNIPILHWLHSIPSGNRDWWNINAYGPNHRLISPSSSNLGYIYDNYKATRQQVSVIPHIKDLRTWFDFCDTTNALIDQYPQIMQAKVVSVYPASSDRLRAKQLDKVIAIMGAIKKRNGNVCLVVPNQWSQGRNQRVDMPVMEELAVECGLVPGFDFIWTSEFDKPKYEMGVPRRVVRELMMCSNLFIFPTTHESFGLVAPEAALCGNYMVLNNDLDVSKEIFGNLGHYVSFGSMNRRMEPQQGWEDYLDIVGGNIMGHMMQDDSIVAQTTVRRSYNMDALYYSHYEPIIMGMLA
jgi:glycosyltransferase involved in cell wall biosynthesis